MAFAAMHRRLLTHIISYHITSYNIISHDIASYHLTYHTISHIWHTISNLIMSCSLDFSLFFLLTFSQACSTGVFAGIDRLLFPFVSSQLNTISGAFTCCSVLGSVLQCALGSVLHYVAVCCSVL